METTVKLKFKFYIIINNFRTLRRPFLMGFKVFYLGIIRTIFRFKIIINKYEKK